MSARSITHRKELRYDNERGKGDHRHVGGGEVPYCFTDLARLLLDFRQDMENWK